MVEQMSDLYLTVKMRSKAREKLEGIDITTSIDVFPWDAALGSEVSVETLDGKILVKIPAGIQTDTKLRIPGKGYIDRQEEGKFVYKNKDCKS